MYFGPLHVHVDPQNRIAILPYPKSKWFVSQQAYDQGSLLSPHSQLKHGWKLRRVWAQAAKRTSYQGAKTGFKSLLFERPSSGLNDKGDHEISG